MLHPHLCFCFDLFPSDSFSFSKVGFFNVVGYFLTSVNGVQNDPESFQFWVVVDPTEENGRGLGQMPRGQLTKPIGKTESPIIPCIQIFTWITVVERSGSGTSCGGTKLIWLGCGASLCPILRQLHLSLYLLPSTVTKYGGTLFNVGN